jgi:hypothetical protein
MRGGAKKTGRKSRENLDGEARAAAVADTAPHPALDGKATGNVLPSGTAETLAVQGPHRSASNDPTTMSHVNDIVKTAGRSVAEWDSTPTENVTGGAMPTADADRQTVVGNAPIGGAGNPFTSTMQSFPRPPGKGAAVTGSAPPTKSSPPATVVGALVPNVGAAGAGARAVPNEPHDPGIVTSQAVRVVVWRDPNGVHVAPAGTVVSSITVDAVLVALEPNADLTAWLSAGDSVPKKAR